MIGLIENNVEKTARQREMNLKMLIRKVLTLFRRLICLTNYTS